MENDKKPESLPLISIGLPVYNDAPWLRNSLDHVLGQDYPNLEIVVADDGSTDGSREICREYAARYPQIRYFENKHNLGAWGNHKFVFDVSQGDYFAWASGHDHYELFFISRMYKELVENPGVVQCSAKLLQTINGKPYIPPGIMDSRKLLPVERIKKLMDFRLGGGSMDIFFGLYRSEFLEKTAIRDTVGADEIMLAELSFMGELMQVNEVMAYKVENRGKVNVRASREAYRAHLDGYKLSKGTILKEYLPRLNSFVEYMNMLDNIGLSLKDREFLFDEIINTIVPNYEKVINEEMDYFVEHFKKEIPALESHLSLQRVQSAHVLSALDMASVLGVEHGAFRDLRTICLTVLGSSHETNGIAHRLPISKKTNMGGRLNGYFQKLKNRLHAFVGDQVWRILSYIFSRYTLAILWILAVLFLYLLLFSPGVYWQLLKMIGLADVLHPLSLRVIELFDLAKGFH